MFGKLGWWDKIDGILNRPNSHLPDGFGTRELVLWKLELLNFHIHSKSRTRLTQNLEQERSKKVPLSYSHSALAVKRLPSFFVHALTAERFRSLRVSLLLLQQNRGQTVADKRKKK